MCLCAHMHTETALVSSLRLPVDRLRDAPAPVLLIRPSSCSAARPEPSRSHVTDCYLVLEVDLYLQMIANMSKRDGEAACRAVRAIGSKSYFCPPICRWSESISCRTCQASTTSLSSTGAALPALLVREDCLEHEKVDKQLLTGQSPSTTQARE